MTDMANWPGEIFSQGEQRELLKASVDALKDAEHAFIVAIEVPHSKVVTLATQVGNLILEGEVPDEVMMLLYSWFDGLVALYNASDAFSPDEELNDVWESVYNPIFDDDDDEEDDDGSD